MEENKKIKFSGGAITPRSAAKDKMMPNGQLVSWDKGLSIEVGKSKVVVGRSFMARMAELLDDDEFQKWIADVE